MSHHAPSVRAQPSDAVSARRPIRSFVRRQGRISDQQQQALVELWQHYGLMLESTPFNFQHIFQRSAPLVLEIGFGMGQSLITQAQQHPEQDYIGIEVHKPGIANVLRAAARAQLTNVRVINADALEVLRHGIPAACLTTVQLFFPDPWPKRRHHKRRLVQPEFLQLLRQKLIPNAIVHFATDWQDYAEHMMAMLSAEPGFVNVIAPQQYALRPAERPLTKFERRGQQLGHAVFDLLFRHEERN